MPVIYGQVGAPSTTSATDSANNPVLQGKQNELIVSELNGKYYTQTYRGNTYFASATGITIPLITSAVVGTFVLYNPAGSTRNLVLQSIDIGDVSATTVVDCLNLYYAAGIGSTVAALTSVTTGSSYSGLLSAVAASSQGKFCTAATSPSAYNMPLLTIINSYGAVTTTNAGPIHREFDGTIILPPASAIFLCASTAAATTSGLAASICWTELPI